MKESNFNLKITLKNLLDRLGLLQPVRVIRRKIHAATYNPRAGIINHANKQGIRLSFNAETIDVTKQKCMIRISSNHEVYLSDMINFFDYYHGAVYGKIHEGISVVDYSKPGVHRLSRSRVEFEFPSLPESDESTEVYIASLNLSAGCVVLDFGAYAGASAYFLSMIVGPEGQVICFEPDEINYRVLQANITRHKLTNVTAIQKGVWSESTNLEFQTEGNMGSSAVDVLHRMSNVKLVPVLSLEDAAAYANGRRIDAIKMDIEGAELAVLKASSEYLKRHKPRLIIEPHIVNGIMVTDECTMLLEKYGYEVELLSQGSQNWPLIAAKPKV